MSDSEAEFREFVAARMESLRGLAYLTCGDWQPAEDAVLGALARLYVRWRRLDNPEAYARTAVVRAAIDETRRPWWRREHAHSHAALPDYRLVAVDSDPESGGALLGHPDARGGGRRAVCASGEWPGAAADRAPDQRQRPAVHQAARHPHRA